MRPRHPHPGTAVAKVARAPRIPSDRGQGSFPIPAPAPAPTPGRGVAIGDSRGKSRSTIGPGPRRGFSGDYWTGTPGMKGRVFHSPQRQRGVRSCPDTQDPPLHFSRPRRPPGYERQRDGDLQNRNCPRPGCHNAPLDLLCLQSGQACAGGLGKRQVEAADPGALGSASTAVGRP